VIAASESADGGCVRSGVGEADFTEAGFVEAGFGAMGFAAPLRVEGDVRGRGFFT
jgi:hypothetical protein